MRKYIAAILLAPLIAACGALGIEAPTPQTPNQRLVVLEYSYQAALKTIDSMVTAGTLKGESARKAAELLKQTSEAMKSARASIKAGGSDAIQAVAVANNLILQLVSYLESQKGQQASWQTPSLHFKFSALSSQQSALHLKRLCASEKSLSERSLKAATLPRMNWPSSRLSLTSLKPQFSPN